MAERRASEEITLNAVAILRSEVERLIEDTSDLELHRVLLSDSLYVDEETSSDDLQHVKYRFEVDVHAAQEGSDDSEAQPVKMLDAEWDVLAQFRNKRSTLLDHDHELTYEVRQLIFGSVRSHMLACIHSAGIMIDLPLQTRRPKKRSGQNKAKGKRSAKKTG